MVENYNTFFFLKTNPIQLLKEGLSTYIRILSYQWIGYLRFDMRGISPGTDREMTVK